MINQERSAAETKIENWESVGGCHGIIHGLVEEKCEGYTGSCNRLQDALPEKAHVFFRREKGILVPMLKFLSGVDADDSNFANAMFHAVRLITDSSSKRHDEVQEIIHDIDCGEETLHNMLIWSEANEKYFGDYSLKKMLEESHVRDRVSTVKTAHGKWNVDPQGKVNASR